MTVHTMSFKVNKQVSHYVIAVVRQL